MVCDTPRILVVMGVSGAGKSSVAQALAVRLGWTYQEGDALHPAANIAKMRNGLPLTDADRAPWLAAIAAWIDARIAAGATGIVTCSALKRAYRDVIIGGHAGVWLVYLRGSRELISARLARRGGHFMPASLLQSQFDTLEAPDADERAITVDVGGSVEDVVETVLACCQLPRT